MSNICIIAATHASSRLKEKNYLEIEGVPLVRHTIDIAKATGIFDAIVLSVDSFHNEWQQKNANYFDDIEILIRASEWEVLDEAETIISKSLEQYELQTGKRFDQCTGLYGTAMFVRPSWIRMANFLVKHCFQNMPGGLAKLARVSIHKISEGDPCYAYVYKIGRYLQAPLTLVFQHYGINLDMDLAPHFYLAQQIMRQIQEGTIDYSLKENEHELSQIINRLKRCNIFGLEDYPKHKDKL